MPELPEVQTTVIGLQIVVNKSILKIRINTSKLRYLVPNEIRKIVNKKLKIIKIYRIAKFIIINLSSNISLIFHLGMSGRIKLVKKKSYNIAKHDHILLYISNKNFIIFNDPIKFGFIDYANTPDILKKKYCRCYFDFSMEVLYQL